MSSPHRTAETAVFGRVLEELAFMFAEPAEAAEWPSSSEPYLLLDMAFEGPLEGTLTLVLPEELAAEITANVLGLEDELTPDQIDDACKEVLNVLCGNLLTELVGDEAVFELCVPEARRIGAAAWQALGAEVTATAFLLDDRPVLLKLECVAA